MYHMQYFLLSSGKFNIDIATQASKIRVNLPAMLCAGREERVRLTAEGEEVRHRISAELKKKGSSKSEAVAITRNDKAGSCLLLVKPHEEGDHLLSVKLGGQLIPNSPFLLHVNNGDYYRNNFKQPVKAIDMRDPRHIAFSSNGDMFVTSGYTHTIHVYDKHGQKKREIGKRGKGTLEFNCPYGIAITGDVLYVADSDNYRIQKLSTDGEFLSMFGTRGSGDGKLNYPTGLTLGPDGMVYISDRYNNRVVVFSETGVFLHNIDLSADVKAPWGLAMSSNGSLHVTGWDSHNYTVYSSGGKLIRRHEFAFPTEVAIDAAGFVFAVRFANESNSLSIFDAQGQVIHTIELDRPLGVAIASDGSVWVAVFGHNKLYKF